MPRRRSILTGFLLLALHAVVASAQQAQPWTGIAADEARPNFPGYSQGNNEIMSHLVSNDTNNWNDVFLRDRQTGELRRISVASDGSQGNHYSAFPIISANGRYVAFNSCATNFDPNDTNNSCDLFINDWQTGATVRANLGPNGEQAVNTTQHYFRLSADGRYFVFNA